MICTNCHTTASHIISNQYGEHCENCSSISVASKNKTDGMLTRESWRIRRQQSRFEGDMVRPHTYDHNLRREIVNPDFVKLYPDKVKAYFDADELKRDGYDEMPEHIVENQERFDKAKEAYQKDTEYVGNQDQAVAKFLDREKELAQ